MDDETFYALRARLIGEYPVFADILMLPPMSALLRQAVEDAEWWTPARVLAAVATMLDVGDIP